jgi:transposase-like protein
MTKKLPPEQKKKRGRPSLYNPEIHPKKAGDLALMGKTNPEIAEAIGVNTDTLDQWRKQFPEFSDAIKKNKDQADSVIVASLYERAKGYEYTEISVKEDPEKGAVTTTTTKQVAPDVTAQIFWLKNRQPKDWRDKQQVEHSGEVNVNTNPTQMTDEEIIALIRKERALK